MTASRARWLLMKTRSPRVRLTAWEASFLESLDDLADRMGDALSLTDEQAAKLEEIAAK